jgi:hypothetical protein
VPTRGESRVDARRLPGRTAPFGADAKEFEAGPEEGLLMWLVSSASEVGSANVHLATSVRPGP